MKLYVGNLPFSASEADLRDLFGQHGEVTDVFIGMDKVTGRSRGFAFVTMGSAEAGTAAINALNDQDFGGRPLRINEAREREERPRFSGGGGGGGGFRGAGGGGGGYRGGGGGGGGYRGGGGGGGGGYGGGGGGGYRGGGGGYGGGGGGGRRDGGKPWKRDRGGERGGGGGGEW